MHERSLVSVKVEPRALKFSFKLSTSVLSFLYFIYVIKIYVR